MKKERLTIENRMLIDQLLKLNYSLKDIADAIDSTSPTVSREIKNRRICGKNNFKECDKIKRFPYVCSCCEYKVSCRKKKYYYNYKKAQEKYEYLFFKELNATFFILFLKLAFSFLMIFNISLINCFLF